MLPFSAASCSNQSTLETSEDISDDDNAASSTVDSLSGLSNLSYPALISFPNSVGTTICSVGLQISINIKQYCILQTQTVCIGITYTYY